MSKPGPTLPFSVVPPPEPLASVVVASSVVVLRLLVVSAAPGYGQAKQDEQDQQRSA